MTPHDAERAVAELLPKLRGDRVAYFPIRHHSPACAAHVRRWIEARRPASVLVEGPESFTGLIPLLLDPGCACPVALYTNFIDRRGRLRAKTVGAEAETLPQAEAPRFAAYYPLCDYSPEMVALRAGREAGARLRFIDLEYAEKVLAQGGGDEEGEREPVRVEDLAADPHLRHSEYVRALARRLGCRDFNDLWDHLFESCWDALETEAFIDRVAAWCAMSRLDYTEEALRRDGTMAREACMAAAIRDELARNEAEGRAGAVLVVTGGFHTVALPDLVAAGAERPRAPRLEEGEAGTWLMRYSFDQLDALAGYASGMPSPAFYDRMWEAAEGAGAGGRAKGDAFGPARALPDTSGVALVARPPVRRTSGVRERKEDTGGQATSATRKGLSERSDSATPDELRDRAAAEMILEIGRLTRERDLPTAVSTPDAIAAVQMSRQLAALRGHGWPLREDVLDGIRSCFVKGELDGEGVVLQALVRLVLAGTKVGRVPASAGVPPIVEDFRREARRLRLPADSIERRETALDLYRKAPHREVSRLFHRLDLLGVPFATFVGGPDFVQGQGLELMQEHWQVAWSPATESSLIEASVFGPTVEDAALARLRQQIRALEDEGQGRSTAAAVSMLVRACRMGLHRQAPGLVPLIDAHVAEDPALPSVVGGLSQLQLLADSREPLEATDLEAVPRLMTAAYQRACRLAGEAAGCPDELVDPVIDALRTLREIVSAAERDSEGGGFDRDLFDGALRRVVAAPPSQAQAAVVGAAAGILYGEGRVAEPELVGIVCGYLGGAVGDARKSAGVLRGLLATAREVAWHVEEVLRALDAQLGGWDEGAFLEALPELRLAFAGLTPREIASVAGRVAALHGTEDLGELVHTDVEENEVRYGLELTRRVREILAADGLGKSS